MFIEILKHTPVWVFFLFAALLYLGYQQSKQRTVSRWRLALLPAGLLGLSIYGSTVAFGTSGSTIACWVAGLAAAIALNRLLQRPPGVRYDAAARAFTVPGSWLPLALMMAMFFARYAVAATLAMNPSLHDSAAFVATGSAAYGFLSGMFVARALHVLGAAKRRAARGDSTVPRETVLRTGEAAGY